MITLSKIISYTQRFLCLIGLHNDINIFWHDKKYPEICHAISRCQRPMCNKYHSAYMKINKCQWEPYSPGKIHRYIKRKQDIEKLAKSIGDLILLIVSRQKQKEHKNVARTIQLNSSV